GGRFITRHGCVGGSRRRGSSLRRRYHVLENQGLLAIAFFETTAFIILLVLFLLFRKDHPTGYFRLWLGGWLCLTLSAACELGLVIRDNRQLWVGLILARAAATLIFLMSVMRYTARSTVQQRPLWPLTGFILAAIYYLEHTSTNPYGFVHWESAVVQSIVLLLTG